MTDIAVHDVREYQTDSRAWLLFEAVGHQQPSATDSGVIDYSKFTKATHYPNDYIPSGTALAWTSDGRLGPASGGGTVAGLLYNAQSVPRDTARKAAVAFVDTFAVVSRGRLPQNAGVTAAVEKALPYVRFRD